MIRKPLLALVALSITLFASAASAQFTILRYSRWVTGTVSGVSGTNVHLFDGRLTVDAANADIRSDYGPATIGNLTPGTRVKAGVHLNPFTGALVAVEVQILPNPDASMRAQITHIDFAAGTMNVLGQTVRFDETTKVYRTSDAALVPVGDLRPLMIVDVEFDRDAPGLVAKTVAFAPGQVNLTTTTGGRVQGMDGDRWTIGGVTVRVTADTYIGGDPQVGERALVTYRGSAAGDLIAVSIRRISHIGEDDVAGQVQAISGQTITIDTGNGATTLRIDEGTQFRGEPQVGDVVVARRNDNTATAVELVFATDFTSTVSGDVASIRGNEWTVQGVEFTVTSTTRITGEPQIGDRVTVIAFELNGRSYAMSIDKL